MHTYFDVPLESGAVIRHYKFQSDVLKSSSRAGFESVRHHTAYIPRASLSGMKLPTVYVLAPWLNAGRMMFGWEPFKEDLVTRVERLVKYSAIPECVIVCPDLYVTYGGSQYINSSFVGNHGDHIVQELVPYVESNLSVLAGAHHRAVMGRSSGGFGALRFAMDYDNVFGAVACHAGDMGFEWVYRRSLIDLCTAMSRYNDPKMWLSDVMQQKKISGFETHVLMLLGMCAFYSPSEAASLGFDIPIDIRTGEMNEMVWNRWLSHDPVQMILDPRVQDRLGSLRALFVDCGNRDQYFLQYGARQFKNKLNKFGVAHDYFEFDDNHSGTTYRFDESLPLLLRAIS